jgi:hypothetical protein
MLCRICSFENIKFQSFMQNIIYHVGFEVLTAASMKMAVFWVVAPCSLVEAYQCFRGKVFFTLLHE